jgi:two-component system, cell cycle response regulator
VTLRGRLTTAFLAVVLGPVLLGAFFVGATVMTVSQDRSMDRLDRAATAARTSVGALCQTLRAAVESVALVADPARRAEAARQVVVRGLASAVRIESASGALITSTPDAPSPPWADCAATGTGSVAVDRYEAIAARVEQRDATGTLLGTVYAAQVLDQAFIGRLAATSGTEVTLLSGSGAGGIGARSVHSTEPSGVRDRVVRAAVRLGPNGTDVTSDGRYVRRAGPTAGQPLPLVLSLPRRDPQGLYALLMAAVVLAAVFAVVTAWWLARSTTQPLAEVGYAADRVADGDLAARVPVRAQDEVGRLASTFNRMTREMQSYVQALTASRDQLRGHLGVLGDTLSSTHDLHRILQVILQTALAATGARAGVVLLLEPGTGTLVGQCAEGMDERRPRATAAAASGARGDAAKRPSPTASAAAASGARGDAAKRSSPQGEDAASERREPPERSEGRITVPVGAGLLGAVAATGVPLRGRVDRDGPALSPFEPRCRTYVAVPFAAPRPIRGAGDTPPGAGVRPTTLPAALGVLALYDRLGSDEFDDADLVTLRTFAGQAAVAVDNVRMHEEAQRLSVTDPLTGLGNYRSLKDYLRREVERAGRFGHMLTALVLDLDRFKEVNDTYGHAAGDAVLAEFARRITAEVREVDLTFRQGGEEFVVLLPETDARGGVVVAERLGTAIRGTPFTVESHHPGAAGQTVMVTVSIGIAVYPDHASSGPELLDAADDALYAAKAAGRDTHRIAEPAHREPTETAEIPVPTGAASPDDGRVGGASSGAQPPRQSRGR